MPVCILCGSETFDEHDGLYFCDKCGTQSQEIRNEVEVEEELDVGRYGNTQMHRHLKKKTKRRRSKYPETDFGKPWLTFEAFQCLLKAQVAALVKLGVNPALKDIVQQIWFQFLKKKNIAFTGAKESTIPFCKMKSVRDRQPGTMDCPLPAQDEKYKIKDEKYDDDYNLEEQEENYDEVDDILKLENEMKENTVDHPMDVSNSESDDSCPEKKQPEHIGSIKYKQDSKQSFLRLQNKPLTVAFIYLGLLYANEPITLADLVRFVRQGNVPFFKMSDVLPGHMKFSKDDAKCFLNTELNLPKIHNGIAFIINFLDLPPLPVPNLHLMIAKLIIDLQLPAAVHRLAVSLLNASGFQPRIDFYTYRQRQLTCNEFYEEMAMSFIIVAVKLIYGLDGDKERKGKISQSCLDVPADTLECWGCIALQLHEKRKQFIQNSYIRKEEDIKYMKNSRDYALFCSEEIFKHTGANQTSKRETCDIHYNLRACSEPHKEQYADIIKHAVNDLENGRMKEAHRITPTSFVFRRFENGEIENVFCKCQGKHKTDGRLNSAEAHTGKGLVGRTNGPDGEMKTNEAPAGNTNGTESQTGKRLVERTNRADGKEGGMELEGGCTEQTCEPCMEEKNLDICRMDVEESELTGDGSYLIYLDDLSGLNVHDSYKFLLSICADRILLRETEMHEYVKQVESMLFVL